MSDKILTRGEWIDTMEAMAPAGMGQIDARALADCDQALRELVKDLARSLGDHSEDCRCETAQKLLARAKAATNG